MTPVVDQALTRAVPSPDGRSWLRWGAATFVGVETVHVTVATAGNEWEGWGVFLSGLSFIVVSGLVLVALVFGLLVRWGLQPSARGRNRAAASSLAAGLLSVAGYAVFFTWAHLLIAPAAILLARAGLMGPQKRGGSRAYAVAGALIGLASLPSASGSSPTGFGMVSIRSTSSADLEGQRPSAGRGADPGS